MNGFTDHFMDVLFLPGHSPAEGLVELRFDARGGSRISLRIPPLEGVLLLRRLEKELVSSGIELPKAQ